MIELVKTPTSNTFFNLVSNCNNEMILCAPYIIDYQIIQGLIYQIN